MLLTPAFRLLQYATCTFVCTSSFTYREYIQIINKCLIILSPASEKSQTKTFCANTMYISVVTIYYALVLYRHQSNAITHSLP